MLDEIEELIINYGLEKHPEGGFYKETYRSEDFYEFGNDSYLSGKRNYSTQILYLVPSNQISKLHRIKSDEIWHFYKGEPFILHFFDCDLIKYSTILGNTNIKHYLQFVIKKGYWFCGEPINNTTYSFMGCTVAPGFDFNDLEFPDSDLKNQIIKKYGNDFIKFF